MTRSDSPSKAYCWRLNITVSIPIAEDGVIGPRVVEALRGYLLSVEAGMLGNAAIESMKMGDVWLHTQAESEPYSLVKPVLAEALG